MQKEKSILFAEKHSRAQLFDDDFYPQQWHLNNIGQTGGSADADIDAPEAWAIFPGSSSIKIAIIDGGIDLDHDDFAGKASGDSYDPNYVKAYHGTHVAGIAAAKIGGGNIRGVDGNAQIIAKQIFSSQGNSDGYLGNDHAAMKVIGAVEEGAHILNNSWGSDGYSPTVRAAFAYAYKMNKVSVASMGNTGTSFIKYPAGFIQGIIAVGATDADDNLYTLSTRGNYIDVTAPGVSILSTDVGNSYSVRDGTSMAAPVVSGIASLLKGYRTSLYNDDIENLIIISADKVPGLLGENYNTSYGYGRVNAKKALDFLRPPYTMTYYTAAGGTTINNPTLVNLQIDASTELPTGNYIAFKHEVIKTVSYPAFGEIYVWGRGLSSTGWNPENTNFAMPFCDVVAGTTTSTNATLRTYLYYLIDFNGQPTGWYPTTPENVVFGYTVLGKPATLTGTMPYNETWSGNASLTGNVTIPTGITLTLKAGSTTNLNGHTIVAAGGTIAIESGAIITGLAAYLKTNATLKGLYPSVQTAINVASSGQTVELLARTYNDLALTISGKSNFKLIGKGADKTFIDQYEGSISITSSSNVLLSDMFVYGPISNTNSSYTVTNNLVYGETCGIYDYNGTNTSITGILSTPGGAAFGVSCYGGGGDVYGNNISGYDVAVYVADNARYNVGPSNNFCENYQDIVAVNGGYVYARDNRYSRPLPATIYGNVDYDYGHNDVCTSLAKRAAKENGIALIEDSASYYPDSLKAIDEEYNSLLAQNKDNEAGFKDILLPVISKYRTFVSGSNTAKDFSLGLQKTMHAYKTFNGKEEFYSYLTELESAAKYKAYSPVINKFKIWKYADAGDYGQAVETADAALSSGINDTELLAGTLYEKGVILRDYLADNEGAKISFEQLIREYPNSPLKRFAEAQLNTVSASKGKADSAAADIKEIVNVFEAGNYPNPFNPATVIRYSIPEGGNVSLKVYDILGREVAKLVNEFQEAGTHSVEFNGSALSSGIYFYELRSGNNVMIKKMLLMK